MDDPKLVKHRHWFFNRDLKTWDVHELRSSKHRVELYVSPTGRSQRVFVNGTEVK